MFDLPDAKRVRREDLYDSGGSDVEDSGSGDEALRQKLNAQLGALLDIDFSIQPERSSKKKPASSTRQSKDVGRDSDDDSADESMKDAADAVIAGTMEEGDGEEEEPLEFAFQLFSGSGPPQKVVLDKADDTVDGAGGGNGNGGFVVPKRPESYYIASQPSREMEERYKSAAVGFEYIFSDARRRNRWGLEKPWRVTSIKVTTEQKKGEDGKVIAVTVAGNEDNEKARKRRPGKKRRIILRTREKVKKEKEVAKKEKEVKAKHEAVDKEQHLLDKKKRLNRAKKLRRRAKAKGQKAAAGEGGDEAGADSDGSE